MKNNLTKQEINEANAYELTLRFNSLLQKVETKPIKTITIADAREIIYIEDELRRRLIKLLGRNFYPPDKIEKKHPSNYMISLLERNKPKPEVESDIKIKFKVTIKSSIGSIIKEKDIYVDSRPEADLLACKMIKDLGLKKATYKIS